MQFKDIFQYYQDDIDKVDRTIKSHSKGKSKLIEEITGHIALSGGKRIRPILTIICAKLIDENAKGYHDLCAAIEIIHTATLLHDDVVDNSDLRRGKKTANAIWGNQLPILVGDFLLSLSFILASKTKSIEIVELLSKTINDMADGELIQLESSKKIDINIDKYYEIIQAKTSTLFQGSCMFGGYYSKATKEQISSLQEYGDNLGSLFQITDDIIDYTSSNKELGKNSGDDFFEGKVTLPVILCYQDADENDKTKIEDLFSKSLSNNSDQNDLENLMAMLQKHNAFDKSYEIAKYHHQKALKSLDVFNDSVQRKHLTSIADFALNRTK